MTIRWSKVGAGLADRLRLAAVLALIILLAAGRVPASAAEPALQVYHAATGVPASRPASGLPAGSLARVYFGELINAGKIGPGDQVSLSLRVGQEPQTVALPILEPFIFEPGNQILQCLTSLPRNAAEGPAELLATLASGTSFSAAIYISRTNFGLLTQNGGAIAQNVRDGQGPTLNGLANAAVPGDFMTLWGTGLGAAAGTASVSVVLAGTSIAPEYAGLAPGLDGVDQINFRLPPAGALMEDCYVPVTVRIAGRDSNEVTISTAATPGLCRHPFGLTPQDLAVLDRNGGLPFASVAVTSSLAPVFGKTGLYARNEFAQAFFRDAAAYDFGKLTGTAVSGCKVSVSGPVNSAAGFFLFAGIDAGKSAILTDATGKAIALSGSGGFYSFEAPHAQDGYALEAVPLSVFTGGTSVLSIDGGTAVGPFQTSFRVAPPLRWTNRGNLAEVPSGGDIDLTWNPEGYGDSDVMTASLYANLAADDDPFQIWASMSCQAAAATGRVRLALAILAAAADGELPGKTGLLTLQSAGPRSAPDLFSAPLVSGESLPGVFKFSFAETIQVTIR